MNDIAWGFIMAIFIVIIIINLIMFYQDGVFGEERQCKDLVNTGTWNSEGHGDNKESGSQAKKSLYNDSLCTFGEKHDKEKIGNIEIKDFTQFKDTSVYKTATTEQKECLNEAHDSPDNGHKAIQGYEIEYCAWDND